jgi:hypothetical protein
VRFYGVVSEVLQQAVEIFPTRDDAYAVVSAWDRDEPDHAGALQVEPVDLGAGGSN